MFAVCTSLDGTKKGGDPELRLKQIQGNTTDTLELVAYKKAVNGFKDEKAETC